MQVDGDQEGVFHGYAVPQGGLFELSEGDGWTIGSSGSGDDRHDAPSPYRERDSSASPGVPGRADSSIHAYGGCADNDRHADNCLVRMRRHAERHYR